MLAYSAILRHKVRTTKTTFTLRYLLMKAALLFIAIFAAAIMLIPLLLVDRFHGEEDEPPVFLAESDEQIPDNPHIAEGGALPVQAPQGPPPYPVDTMTPSSTLLTGGIETIDSLGVSEFRILVDATGEVKTVPLRDFLRGAVAAEMPARFHSEALKAQAVAAHTFALRQHMIQAENPDPRLRGADFSVGVSNMMAFATEEQAHALFGPNADGYWDKITQAVDSVIDLILVYGDRPIVAAFHAMSAGMTECASNVWIGGAPYLVPAQSIGDLLAPNFETIHTISAEQFRQSLSAQYPAMVFGENRTSWIGGISRSSSGYVTEIEIGGVKLHGRYIREIFDLRSHNFEITIDDGGVTFIVFGHGHGVGLSQYGADFLARQGYGFREILANYYSGAELRRLTMNN